MCRARNARGPEAFDHTGTVSEDCLGQRAQAAEDPRVIPRMDHIMLLSPALLFPSLLLASAIFGIVSLLRHPRRPAMIVRMGLGSCSVIVAAAALLAGEALIGQVSAQDRGAPAAGTCAALEGRKNAAGGNGGPPQRASLGAGGFLPA